MLSLPPASLRSHCIYVIENSVTGFVYIGQSRKVRARLNSHFSALRRGDHGNPHLQNSWSAHGENAFSGFVLCEFEDHCECDKAEIFYIAWFKAVGIAFNNDGGGRGPERFTEETRAKLRAAHIGKPKSPEAIEKTRQANLGIQRSEETKARLRETHLGFRMPESTKDKIRQFHLGKPKKPEAIEKTRQFHLGRKRSPDVCEKNRQARLGKPLSEETKRKLSEAGRGRKRSPEAIEKTRLANLGRKRSDEAKRKMRESHLLDMTGQVFGRLTAIKYTETRGGQPFWLCTCTCGKSREVRGYLLRKGITQSCGCLRAEVARRKRNGPHETITSNGQLDLGLNVG